MTVKIHLADKSDAKKWDMLISESPFGTLFHSWTWLHIIENHTHTKLYPVIGTKDNNPIGAYPLFFQRKGPIKTIFSPPPHVSVPYLGPVLIGKKTLIQEKWEQINLEFLGSVEHFINNELKVNYLNISLPPHYIDPRHFLWSGYTVKPVYDYSVDTSKGIENLYKSLDYNKRAELKKANERGMTVEIGTKNEYEKILDLMDVRYAQQARFFTASKPYFLDVFEHYKDNMKIFFVVAGGEVITGIICLEYGDSLYGWIGNSRSKNRMSPSPNHLLFWEIVRYASEHGFNYYTIMGAAGNERLHEFYAARFDPELRIRYAAVKRTMLTGVFEAGYTNIIRPLRGKIKHMIP
jgi:hypothetical protein